MQQTAILDLVGQHATFANFSHVLEMVYDPTNTVLASNHRRTLVQSVLHKVTQAESPGLVHNVKAVASEGSYSGGMWLCVLT
jgi:hypothetical protein